MVHAQHPGGLYGTLNGDLMSIQHLVSRYVDGVEFSIKSKLSLGTRNKLARKRVELRKVSALIRPLPNLLIVGAMRAGTSSLYKYLSMHPNAHRSVRKEVEYFSQHYHRTQHWYRAHWPVFPILSRDNHVYFEASPNYLFHPLAAKRAKQLVPEAKVIVLLRDPVERAFSHYRHMERLGYECLPFADAVEAEAERTAEDWTASRANPETPLSKAVLRYSYLRRGHYVRYLKEWIDHFGHDRVHVINFDTFYDDPATRYSEVLEFTGLLPWFPYDFVNYSFHGATRPDAQLDPALKHQLREHFQSSNEELFDLIGTQMEW